MKKITPQSRVREMPPTAISMDTTLFNKTGSWRNFRPVYRDKLPPCNAICPAGEKVQRYLDLVKKNKFAEAWQTIKADNPFPAVCGRVCFHHCETECNRKYYDEAIGIHIIERLIGDYGLEHHLKIKPRRPVRKEPVAVIGGGPAGISCAYHLARLGYQPTIFEAEPLLGGLLQYGLPDYRLPKDVLQAEIKSINQLGITVRTSTRIGKDITFAELAKDYRAVVVATGAYKERALGIPGENSAGVIDALDFLHAVNSGHPPAISKEVVIIGSGNAANDAARSARRLGAKITIISPAKIRPVRIIVSEGKVAALECIKLEEKSGVPVNDSNYQIKAGTIIRASGQMPETKFLPAQLVKDGLVQIGSRGETTQAGIFAAGDAVTGPHTATDAIGAGKKTAWAVDEYLRTGRVKIKEDEKVAPVRFEQLNMAYFTHAPRVPMSDLAEGSKGYKPEEARAEAERCFSCGICNFCDNCWVFCPDMSVIKKKGKYEFNYDYCKGCGLCATECPRNAISLVEEKK